MPSPQCSVIIPAYNAMEFLPDAIASIQMQEASDVEILVCDDGSSDGTIEWLHAAAIKDPRIRIFQGNRFGPAKARNYLINKAKSELIAFLDADDTWLPGKLRSEIEFHTQHSDVVFSFTDYRHVDLAGNLRSTAFDYWKPEWLSPQHSGFKLLPDALNELLATNVVGTSCVVAKREFLRIANGFAEHLPSAEDWDLWLRLAALGPVAGSREVTMHYLMRPGSETSNRAARVSAMETVLAECRSLHPKGWAVRLARARVLSSRAQWMHETARPLAAAFYAWAAFVLRPQNRMFREALAFSKCLALHPFSARLSSPARGDRSC